MRLGYATAAASLSLVAGCSAGPATVDAQYDEDDGVVRLVFSSEGKNTFEIAGRSCDAPKGGECSIEVPVTEMEGGWNILSVATKRRTGMELPLSTEVHLGPEAFPRECEAAEVTTARREDSAVELRCTFPAGYSGVLWGEPLADGRRRIPASKLVAEAAFDEATKERWPTPSDPLLVVDVPVEVVNAGGGRMQRPIRVAVPAPFVQFEVSGFERLWFERALPLRLRAEEGAVISIDGKRVRPEREGEEFVVERLVDRGDNVIEVKAEIPGRVPSVHTLEVEGRFPESPLHIDEPLKGELTTDSDSLRVRGRTHPKAEVFWGRIPVPVRPDGSFVVDAYLEEGRNDVEISAFLAETKAGRLTRKPATRTFVVDRVPVKTTRVAPGAEEPEAEQLEPLSIEEVAEQPWQTVGETVRFSMRADDVSLFPSETGCTASLEGIGCGREVTRTAHIAFRDVLARTCVGKHHPTFVELDFCPKLEDGTWVEVEGVVQGGFAGRGRTKATIVRLRVRGTSVEERARLVRGDP